MSAIVGASHLAIGLFALWVLYFFGWREHRIDTYRQRIFAVRDELFDFAASGVVQFNDPAYTTLRDLSNGLIRFAHRLTFTRVWVIMFFGGTPRTNRMERWMEDVKGRPQEVRDKLLRAHDEIAKASLRHVVAWSPLAWIYWAVSLIVKLLTLRVKVVVRVPIEISAVLEREALEQSSLIDDDSCLAAV